MNKIALILLLLLSAYSFADNFKCKSRNGWASGNGRYSYEGEFVDYFGVHARAGEYVKFQYPNGGKYYWFRASDCVEL